MTEHMNEAGMCYCSSLDCIGNVRAMLASMAADRNDTMAQLEQAETKLAQAAGAYQATQETLSNLDAQLALVRGTADGYEQRLQATEGQLRKLQDNWSKVKDELQQYVDQGDFDLNGDTMHQFLFDEFELTLIEEVEVRFIIEVSASVKRPKGEEVNEYDFNLDDVSISVADSDWDIEITDYSFSDVDEA